MRLSMHMPAEHGAWAILLVPFACAAAVAGVWNTPLLLCGVCVVALFLLRGSLNAQASGAQAGDTTETKWERLLTPGHLLLGAVAGAAGGLLVLFYRRDQLFWLGLVAALLYVAQLRLTETHRRDPIEKRSLLAELVGVTLLTLAAPAAWIAARGSLFDRRHGNSWADTAGVLVWLLNVLFFFGGVLYVKYRVRGLLVHRNFRSLGERLSFVWPVFLYHLLLAVFLACWIGLDLPAHAGGRLALRAGTVGLAFAPAILRANGLLVHLGQRFPIRRLGWSEVIHSAVFALLLILAFRLSA